MAHRGSLSDGNSYRRHGSRSHGGQPGGRDDTVVPGGIITPLVEITPGRRRDKKIKGLGLLAVEALDTLLDDTGQHLSTVVTKRRDEISIGLEGRAQRN